MHSMSTNGTLDLECLLGDDDEEGCANGTALNDVGITLDADLALALGAYLPAGVALDIDVPRIDALLSLEFASLARARISRSQAPSFHIM